MTAAFCPACRHSIAAAADKCLSCGVPRPPAGWPFDPMIGKLVDEKYRVDKRLSTGGFGTVFLATQMHGQQELGTAVLKFLHPELAHDPGVSKRFVTEAKAARELTSSHVVRVFDLGFDETGIPFMVQEYVAGEGLDAIIRQTGAMPVERVVRVGMQVAEAMDEAHRKGILHRDLKPENLRVQQTIQGDFVKVLDFGIARVERGTSAATNSFIGTPRYMAPEQIKQKGVDARADIFALGVILFEMLTGEPPIVAESEMEYIHLNLVQEPREVRVLRPGAPPSLADLIMRMMAKDKEARPASMALVYSELRSDGSADTAQREMTLPFGGETGTAVGDRVGGAAGGTVRQLPRSRRNLIVAAAAGAILVVGSLVGIGVLAGGEDPHPPAGIGMPPPGLPMTAAGLGLTAMPSLPVTAAAPDPGTTVATEIEPPDEPPRTSRPRPPRNPRPPRAHPETARHTGVTKIND